MSGLKCPPFLFIISAKGGENMAEKQVTIEVLDAVIEGKGKGERLKTSERSAKYLERIGYAKIIEEQPRQEPQKRRTSKKRTEPKKEAEPKREETTEKSE